MPDAVAVRVPQLNVNDEQVRIVSWLVGCGEKVEKGQPLVEVETGKATTQIDAPEAGYVRYTHRADDEVAVGEALCTISPEPQGAGPAEAPCPPPVPPPAAEPPPNGQSHTPALPASPDARPAAPGPASPPGAETPSAPRFSARARALLEAHGIAPGVFEGRGLVREADVLQLLNPERDAPAAAPGTAPEAGQAPPAKPGPGPGVPVRSEPLPRQKLLEVRLLASNSASVLASSVTATCRTAGFRRAVAREPSLRGNPAALIVFEAARLLREYPVFNGYFEGKRAFHYQEVNVGFAVDAGRGLKVPVVRGADTKTAPAIADEMHELVGQYLEDRLPPDALSGGTFTLTDLSGEGVTTFAPLINHGQSAILGVGAERFFPSHEVGEFNLVLSFDHRLTEGRTAARFLNALRERLAAHESALNPVGGPTAPGRPAAEEEIACARCLRGADEMRQLGGYLVRSAFPEGYLCSFCLSGF